MIRELAPAKVNLMLHVGRPRPDGLHPVCSLLASLDLCDELEMEPATENSLECPGVNGENLVTRALEAFRGRAELPPVAVRIDKRIPVAAGLAGGSADAAAALRAANRLAGEPLDAGALRELGAGIGSDVPSQIEPRHALVQGVGELVEPVDLPGMHAVLVPSDAGLSTADVYAELDRRGGGRERLDAEPVRALVDGAASSAPERRAALASGLENDLEPVALGMRPELADTLAALRDAGAPAAAVSGSGPTCFALFADRADAERAADAVPGAIVAPFRETAA
jgi:4-diphosphocytidyl-2-C-methyl-D-erythritol kinase